MDEQQGPEGDAGAALPRLVLEGLDQTRPEFVNFMQISYDASAFRIAFCRYLPTLALRPEDMDSFRATIEKEGFRVEVVSQLIVAPAVLRSMVQALEQQLFYYQQQWGEIPSFEAANVHREDEGHGS